MNKIRTLPTLIVVLGLGLGTAGLALAASSNDDPVPPQGPNEKTALLDSFGMTRADSQTGIRTASGKQLYVNQTASEVCITDSDGSGHCAPRSGLAKGLGFGGELCVADLPSDQVRITGVLPPGAAHVSLTAADGSTFEADAVNDSIAFEIPRVAVGDGKPVEVTWTTGNGTTNTLSVRQPPIVASANC